MICSRNEVGAVLAKAAIGSGFPVGLATDLAAAGVWLCTRGLDGVGAVVDAIATDFQPEIDCEIGTSSLHMSDAAVARCGPSPFELLVAGDVEVVIMERTDAPLLLLGLAGIVAGRTEAVFALSVGAGVPIIVDAHSMSFVNDLSSGSTDSIRISLVDPVDSDSTDQRLRPHGVEVDERWWTAARGLAARTHVPASDDSRRRGAGAGLLDND